MTIITLLYHFVNSNYIFIIPPLEALVTNLEYLANHPVLIFGSNGFKFFDVR